MVVLFSIVIYSSELKCRMKALRNVHRCHKKHRDEDGKCTKKRWRYWKRHLVRHELYKRIRYCSSFIEDVLERGQNVDKTPTLQELGVLYRSNHVSIERLESTAFDATKRFDYLKELIEKYRAMDGVRKNMTEHAGSFICLSASSSHPVTKCEKDIVSILAKGLSGHHHICIKTDDLCGEELRIDIAYYDV